MPNHLLGQFCALMAALTWAAALVLFKKSGESVAPLALNLFKSVAALMMFAVTLAVMPGLAALGLLAPCPPVLGVMTAGEWWTLALSAVVGIAVADTLFFWALNRIGVGIIVVVDCLYSPATIFFAWLLLREHLLPVDYVGGGLVLIGVFISTRHTPPPGRTRGEIVAGVGVGGLAMVCMGYGIVIAKPVIERYDVFWITAIRLLIGTAALALFVMASPRRKLVWAAFKPARVWRQSLPASFLGNYLALTFWVAGFKYTTATAAAILNQMSVIFAVALAYIFLKERLDRKKVISLVLACVGALVILTAKRA